MKSKNTYKEFTQLVEQKPIVLFDNFYELLFLECSNCFYNLLTFNR